MSQKILIIDDDLMTLASLEAILNELGFTDVVTADDSGQALRLLLVHQFDLLLVDWMLPGLSGLELVKRVRMGVKHAEVPIIMVTGQNDKEQVQEAAAAGINGYVLKPPSKETLAKALARAGMARAAA